MNLKELALKFAIAEIGVQEVPKGSNGGPRVNQYLKAVGLGAGNPWCLAFVYWCVDQAAQQLDLPNPLIKTGHVKTLWDGTKLRKLPAMTSAVQPGDIGIMLNKDGTGHAFFIEIPQIGQHGTIDGNTNHDGSREGYDVERKERLSKSMAGVIQLP